MQKGIRL